MLGGLVIEGAQAGFGVADAAVQSRLVFGASGTLALGVLALTARVRLAPLSSPREGAPPSAAAAVAPPSAAPSAARAAPAFAQPLLRWIALVCSLSITTGVAVYALFASTYLGYGQRAISASQSAAAAAALCCQLLLLPWLVDAVGEARSCVAGLVLLGLAFGAFGLVRRQPAHFLLFVASRGGHSLADVSTAALTASASTPEARGRNLALLNSFQAGSRLVSPLVASYLYTLSTSGSGGGLLSGLGPAGALPFLLVSALALCTAPAPLLLAGRLADGDEPGGRPGKSE